jgi:16S rRNA (adenine1518-N6/adenine1519-N6)-dimethyltransferase
MVAHTARKRFGQHFLVDGGVLSRIVAAINPCPGDHLVEIGPGLAALTDRLLQHLPRMDAVELDRDLVSRLRRRYPPERLVLHEADALSFDFAALADR